MSREKKIRQAIEAHFAPIHLEISNESRKHAGHAGDDGSGESHFRLLVVSSLFAGKTRLQRHQQVHSALSGLFEDGLHALSMKLYTPEEYKTQ